MTEIPMSLCHSAFALEPCRLSRAQDDVVVWPKRAPLLAALASNDAEKIRLLRRIDARVERDVDAPQPPTGRQPDGKVAAALRKEPSPHGAALTELAHKIRETVVPIMVAGNCEQIGRRSPLRRPRARTDERRPHLAAIAIARRSRIHEIAAQHHTRRRR